MILSILEILEILGFLLSAILIVCLMLGVTFLSVFCFAINSLKKDFKKEIK